MNSLFSELNFKILEAQLEDHLFGGPCPKPEILRSTRGFENVNLENWRKLRWSREFSMNSAVFVDKLEN